MFLYLLYPFIVLTFLIKKIYSGNFIELCYSDVGYFGRLISESLVINEGP